MTKRFLGLALILFCANCTFSQSARDRGDDAKKSDVPAVSADQDGLKGDLQKMQTLLGQMQRNVAFVSAGDTPLKHQFELEIEMWRMLLKDIETRTNQRGANEADRGLQQDARYSVGDRRSSVRPLR